MPHLPPPSTGNGHLHKGDRLLMDEDSALSVGRGSALVLDPPGFGSHLETSVSPGVCKGFNQKSPTGLLEGLEETRFREVETVMVPAPYPNRPSDTCRCCNEPSIRGGIQARCGAQAQRRVLP